MKIKIIAGLGNPGAEYSLTKHNTGFLVIDQIAAACDAENFEFNKKFNAEIANGKIGKTKVILVKPQTMMNSSGQAIRPLMNFYKIKSDNLFVIHDDKDILFGEFKIQTNRGPAGHNGVISVMKNLKTENFTRIRVGTSPANRKKIGNIIKFVMSSYSKSELAVLKKTAKQIFERLESTL